MTKTVKHPSLPYTLTFNPDDHSYTDNESRPYISVTTLVTSLFPPFDEQAQAAKISQRSGSLEMSIIQQWRAKAKASAAYGTSIHAYAESRILGKDPCPAAMMIRPAMEQRAFGIIDNAISMLSDTYDFLPPEQIIFDPLYQIAGTIDLPATNRATGALAILDWKSCEEITNQSYNNALLPFTHIRDSKINHYALQLSLYALLFADPGYSSYPTDDKPVELAVIHIHPSQPDPVWIPLPYLRQECIDIIDARLETLK